MTDQSPEIQTYPLSDDGTYPNHPRWPLLIYPGAVQIPDAGGAQAVEDLFALNGWGGLWRNGIYSFHHYHSNAHEVLGLYQGRVTVQFGGPQGVVLKLQAGDVAVLPAGTAHCNLGDDGKLGVVGGYPEGDDWDLCRGSAEEYAPAKKAIADVGKPKSDPVCGLKGGLVQHWK